MWRRNSTNIWTAACYQRGLPESTVIPAIMSICSHFPAKPKAFAHPAPPKIWLEPLLFWLTMLFPEFRSGSGYYRYQSESDIISIRTRRWPVPSCGFSCGQFRPLCSNVHPERHPVPRVARYRLCIDSGLLSMLTVIWV